MVMFAPVHPVSSSSPTLDSKPTSVVWLTMRTLRKVLRNSLFSVAIAWVFAFCCSVGDIFSDQTPKQQSFESFLVANMLWFHVFFCVATVSIYLSLLCTEQLLDCFSHRSPLLHWVRRLTRLTFLYVIVIALAVVGGCVALSRMLDISNNKSKLSVYFGHMCFYVFVACTEVQARHLYRTETGRGQARTLQQTKRLQRYPSTTRSKKPVSPHRRRFLRVLLQDLPLIASAFFATAYVHIVSSVNIATQWNLAVFVLCSISLKLLLQEVAKSFLSKKRRTPNFRTMAIIVAAPTILIDTQLRTVLLCQENASMTVVGSLALAVAEIFIRVCRTAFVNWEVRRVKTKRPSQASSTVVVSPTMKWAMRPSQIRRTPVRMTSSLSMIDPIQDRVNRLLSLHAAEIYSDMHAEYIAMGCSYGILFFFGSHPKYQLGNNSNSSRWTNASITRLQLRLEVVVDFVACALEIRRGIDFEHFNQDDSFLSVFVMAVALVNVHISSGIYLRA